MRFLIFAIFCSAFAIPSRAQEPGCWVVIGVIGKWSVVNSQPNDCPGSKKSLSPGARILGGTSVSSDTVVKRDVKEGEDKTFGSLTLLVNGAPVTYACDDEKTLPDHSNAGCVNPIHLSSASERSHEGNGFLAKLASLIPRDPDRYYMAVSRDYGNMQDAVVEKTGNGVDLRPALGSTSKGEYLLTFEKIDPGKAPRLTGTFSPLKWDPDSGQAALAPGVAPGLYDLKAETTDHEPVGEAWILVASTQDYARKASAFAEVTKTTASWKSNTPAAGIRAVSRAALDELSR